MRTVLLFGLVLLLACGDDAHRLATVPTSDSIDATLLVGAWTHSYEEEPDSLAVDEDWYRPSDSHDFEPSLFRMRYEFRDDGTCEYLWASPVDAHEMRPCTWGFDRVDDRVVRVTPVSEQDDRAVSFRVLGLSEDLLRVDLLQQD